MIWKTHGAKWRETFRKWERKGSGAKALEKGGRISLLRKEKRRWKTIQKWEGGKDKGVMTQLQLFEADGRDWTDVMTRTMFSTRQETWLSAGGQEGRRARQVVNSQRIPFGIPWEFYRELVGSQQEMTK